MTVDVTLSHMPSGILHRRTWSNDSWRHAKLSCIVAIPACNEATRIASCLASLATQNATESCGVLVFVNGTSDATIRRAVAHGRRHQQPLCVIDAQLPRERRDAGTARCVAMQLALSCIDGEQGCVFTTDADSMAPPGWLATYRGLLSQGYDAVAGVAAIAPDDANDMPRSLKRRELLEQRYAACLDALECHIDPIPHDPWPRHYHASGANLAMSKRCLTALGKLAWPAVGEDRFVVAQAEAHGMRVRHDVSCQVLTSGRIFGRARGGMADTMRHRILEPESPCDERLEAVERAYFRARVRRQCRDVHAVQEWHADEAMALALRLRLDHGQWARTMRNPCFGAAWAQLERLSPRLHREPITPGQLAHQCSRAEMLLSRLGAPLLAQQPQMAAQP